MMLKVILLEGNRHGNANGKVGKNAKPSVIDWSGESEVVTELMNGEEEIVVQERAKKVGNY